MAEEIKKILEKAENENKVSLEAKKEEQEEVTKASGTKIVVRKTFNIAINNQNLMLNLNMKKRLLMLLELLQLLKVEEDSHLQLM